MSTVIDGEQGEPGPLAWSARAFNWWFAFWSWIVGIFVLFLTVTNFLHGLFHFELLPVFENTLDGFRAFAHWALDSFLLSWITAGLAQCWYGITWMLSHFFTNITAYVPQIVIPGWYKDLALVSMILARAQRRTLYVINYHPDEVARLRANMPEEERRTREAAHNKFSILRTLRDLLLVPGWLLDDVIYYTAEVIGRTLQVISRSPGVYRATHGVVEAILRGVTLIGVVMLAASTIDLVVLSKVPGNYARYIKTYVALTWTNLTIATTASLVFAIWNGYALGH